MAEQRRSRMTRRTDRKTENEAEQQAPKADFSEAQKRSEYLKHKLDDILDNIGQSYGKRMADELMKRLEKTIVDFNSEVVQMLDKLEVLEEQRLKDIKMEQKTEPKADTDEAEASEADGDEPQDEFANMSEFEKRIEMLERQKKEKDEEAAKSAEEEEKKPKKKGLFRKKKK